MTTSPKDSDRAAAVPYELREAVGQLTALGVDLETIAGRFAQASGLHPTDVRALRILSDATTEVTAGELGERLALSSGATTRMIDRMERSGYLARARSTGDRRVVHVQMTPQAWAAAEVFFGRLGPVIDDAMSDDFSTDELAVVSRFLTAAAAAIRTAARSTTTPPEPVP